MLKEIAPPFFLNNCTEFPCQMAKHMSDWHLEKSSGGTSSVSFEGEMKRERSKPSLVFTATCSLPAAES